jgi:hypothetical protein
VGFVAETSVVQALRDREVASSNLVATNCKSLQHKTLHRATVRHTLKKWHQNWHRCEHFDTRNAIVSKSLYRILAAPKLAIANSLNIAEIA